eukprot:TRINITY_DN2385_c0_g1_i2.p1 TRINITY_DN2385_c0_g1~~TRINITY_DN2385_c0_g1_i2.p1  ORF type:complete len:117 (-),score=20.95 TRINITY_DN2385_c0_g1_i2:214-564(-)
MQLLADLLLLFSPPSSSLFISFSFSSLPPLPSPPLLFSFYLPIHREILASLLTSAPSLPPPLSLCCCLVLACLNLSAINDSEFFFVCCCACASILNKKAFLLKKKKKKKKKKSTLR